MEKKNGPDRDTPQPEPSLVNVRDKSQQKKIAGAEFSGQQEIPEPPPRYFTGFPTGSTPAISETTESAEQRQLLDVPEIHQRLPALGGNVHLGGSLLGLSNRLWHRVRASDRGNVARQ
jgi:hypothetical protein